MTFLTHRDVFELHPTIFEDSVAILVFGVVLVILQKTHLGTKMAIKPSKMVGFHPQKKQTN